MPNLGGPGKRVKQRRGGADTRDMSNLVVAHCLDGRVVKGTSLDVDPNKPGCHIRAEDRTLHAVQLSGIKALYFVRSLSGDPARNDRAQVDPADLRSRGAKHVRVVFTDGEALIGFTYNFPPTRAYFFLLPADPASNNIRILVNRAATRAIEAFSQAA